jgi:hypothetical protein
LPEGSPLRGVLGSARRRGAVSESADLRVNRSEMRKTIANIVGDGHMSTTISIEEPPRIIGNVTKVYSSFLIVGFALVPAYLIAYLAFFQDRA